MRVSQVARDWVVCKILILIIIYLFWDKNKDHKKNKSKGWEELMTGFCLGDFLIRDTAWTWIRKMDVADSLRRQNTFKTGLIME